MLQKEAQDKTAQGHDDELEEAPKPRESEWKVQMRQALAGMSYGEQVEALKPPRPSAGFFPPLIETPDVSSLQMQAGSAGSTENVHAAAAHGLQGAGQSLPHLERIQQSFGSVDLSGVKANVGGEAATASAAMGAKAYASGDKVAFESPPDLHTAAHEAAHIVQQAQGVSLPGGVGRAGDKYEKHADAVADRVVRGESAQPLLGGRSESVAGGGAVQMGRKKKTSGSDESGPQLMTKEVLQGNTYKGRMRQRGKRLKLIDSLLDSVHENWAENLDQATDDLVLVLKEIRKYVDKKAGKLYSKVNPTLLELYADAEQLLQASEGGPEKLAKYERKSGPEKIRKIHRRVGDHQLMMRIEFDQICQELEKQRESSREVETEEPETDEEETGTTVVTEELAFEQVNGSGLASFIRKALGLDDPTSTGSVDLSLKISVGIGAGLPKILEVAIGPYITLSGSMNVGDDRRLRVSTSLAFGVEGSVNILRLFKVHASVEAEIGLTGAYDDDQHLAAHILNGIHTLMTGYKQVLRGQAQELDVSLRNTHVEEIERLGGGSVSMDSLGPKVIANSESLGAEAGAEVLGTVGISGGAKKKKTKFHKKDAQGEDVEKEGTTREYQLGASFSLPLLGDFEITGTRTIIENDSNPDNDGDYLNIALAASGGGFIPEPVWVALAGKSAGAAHLAGTELGPAVKSLVEGAITEVESEVTGSLGATFGLQWNFVSKVPTDKGKDFSAQLADGDYSLQYARVTKALEIKAGGSVSIPVGGFLNVSGGAEVTFSRTTMVVEFLGNQTLTYTQTVYDGLMNRGERGASQWQGYREGHALELAKICSAVDDPESAAHGEARELADSDVKPRFLDACSTIGPDVLSELDESAWDGFLEGKFPEIAPILDEYLAAMRAQVGEESAKTWRMSDAGVWVLDSQDMGLGMSANVTKWDFTPSKKSKKQPEECETVEQAWDAGHMLDLRLRGYSIKPSKKKHKTITVRIKVQRPDSLEEAVIAAFSPILAFDDFPHSLLYCSSLADFRFLAQEAYQSGYQREEVWQQGVSTFMEALIKFVLRLPND